MVAPESSEPFYRIVREERLFCAVLAHLLMQRGDNLLRFINLVNDRLPHGDRLDVGSIEEAEIYLEFSRLRDEWHQLGGDNEAKRRHVATLMERVPSLAGYTAELPADIGDYNQVFVGGRARHWTRNLAFPGQWSVGALYDREGTRDPKGFRDLCRFKWAFNIKPDLVVMLPGARPLCVEAKLESSEGSYPADREEVKLFDRTFGKGRRRVRQLELQRFMFEHLLDDPCVQIVVGTGPERDVPVISWSDAFDVLDLDGSIPYVRSLVTRSPFLAR